MSATRSAVTCTACKAMTFDVQTGQVITCWMCGKKIRAVGDEKMSAYVRCPKCRTLILRRRHHCYECGHTTKEVQ